MTTATARTLELRFEAPPPELSPNVKKHHMVKARAVRQYRWECNLDARNQAFGDWKGPVSPLTSPVKATVTFVVPDKRRRDTDNLMAALKPLWDGLRDARVLVDDSHEHLRHGEPSVRVEKGQRYVLVTLEEQR